MKKLLIFLSLFTSLFSIELNQSGLGVVLEGKNGGDINGKRWNSSSLKGKTTIFFYVDPDSPKSNEEFANRLKKENFKNSKVCSIAVVNLDSWIPDFLIENRIKSRQKEFPKVTYLKDKTEYLLKKWGFRKDSTDVLIFNKNAKVIFKKLGKLSQKEIIKAINIIKKSL